MKNNLLYIINLIVLLSFSNAIAQQNDSIPKTKLVHRLRLGVDLSKPIIAAFNSDYQGMEFVADYKLKNRIYLAGEYGFETRTLNETSFSYTTTGSFFKIGADYNIYDNLIGMDNMIFFGLRYGHSSFSHTLENYSTNTTGQYWPTNNNNNPIAFDNLSLDWIGLSLGLKTEIYANIFLGASLQLNRLVSQTAPSNFKNLYAPGYNRVGLNDLNVSFNYTISYSIPLQLKKEKQTSIDE